MKFRGFKRFAGKGLNEVIDWIQNELNSVMGEVFIGFSKLRFQDNFTSYEVSLTLAPTEERQISHPFREIPSGYIIFKQVGDGVIDAGLTPWTTEVVYIRNNSAVNSVVVTVIFFV